MTSKIRIAIQAFPAASLAISIAISSSLATLAVIRILNRSSRPRIFLLGDSCIGNYRLHPGRRFEDILQKANPGYRIDNLAEPGAAPLDYLMQSFKGRITRGDADHVILAMTPDKFLESGTPRLDEDGANLRWLPWNRFGLEIWGTLSPQEREKCLVQQINFIFFGPVDALRALWIRFVQWPWERYRMWASGIHRHRLIYERTVAIGKDLETTPIGSPSDFSARPRAQDAAEVLSILRQERIRTLVVILPYANPSLVEKAFSPLALAKRDSSIVRMKQWLDQQGATYIDFNQPQCLSQFPDNRWDDHVHLKDSRAYAYMATEIDHWIAEPSFRSH